jgi:hypothetical protein
MSLGPTDQRLRVFSGVITPLLLVAYLVGYESMSAWRAAHDPILRPLARQDRDAMRWIADNTSPTSAFAVMTGGPFSTDSVSEWFPVLSRRISVATVQGYEWLPGRQFERRWERYDALQDCAKRDVECLRAWARHEHVAVTHVYLRNGCCQTLQHTLEHSADYRQTYSQAGSFVYEHTVSASGMNQ